MLQATLGLSKQQRTNIMKDFILGSEEYIIGLTEEIEVIRNKYGLDTIWRQVPSLEEEEQDACADDLAPRIEVMKQNVKELSKKLAQHNDTAACILNDIICKLSKLHDALLKKHWQKHRALTRQLHSKK